MFYDKKTVVRNGFRDDENHNGNSKKGKHKRWQVIDREFRCAHCKQMVFMTSAMGTVHRNHCPHCLYSLHVDTKPGNRASECRARMAPIGLTCKYNGFDKYGNARDGDIMIIHACTGCGTFNINRIAGDDSCHAILDVFKQSLSMDESQRKAIEQAGIKLLQTDDTEQLHTALFGKGRL